MPISESMVQDIVQEVMAKMQIADAPTGKHGVFKDMNDAIEAAKKSQQIVKKMSMDQREKIITCIRKKIKENAEVLARMGVDETGMGNVGDKILKHQSGSRQDTWYRRHHNNCMVRRQRTDTDRDGTVRSNRSDHTLYKPK